MRRIFKKQGDALNFRTDDTQKACMLPNYTFCYYAYLGSVSKVLAMERLMLPLRSRQFWGTRPGINLKLCVDAKVFIYTESTQWAALKNFTGFPQMSMTLNFP